MKKASLKRMLGALRTMAWKRAKGELTSMLSTFTVDLEEDDQYALLEKAITEFIEFIEGRELEQ